MLGSMETMRKLLTSTVLLSALAFGACAGKTGPAPTLENTDPASISSVEARNFNDFKAVKATFTLRIKNFEVINGRWAPSDDMGVTELEREAIHHLQQAGFTYTPDPDQSRYNIEFHLTCYDPVTAHQIKSTPEEIAPFLNDGVWGPYTVAVFTIHSGSTQQSGPPHCSGRMLLLVRDHEESSPVNVYAAHHDLNYCPYEQGCSFDTCLEPHKKEILKYLDIVFR